MRIKKSRLDVLLVERGLAETREKARAMILSGLVTVNGERADKAGHSYAEDVQVALLAPTHSYVSRGGLKLEKALREFGISVVGKNVLDVGASTGGFTDCALQHGAAFVSSVDVGSGQLAWKLRQDPRVQVLEKTNIRNLSIQMLERVPEIATVDVSFISLKLVFPVLNSLLPARSQIVALIKPQFEAGREAVSRGKGVIRDKDIHLLVINDILHSARLLGWGLCGLTYSPITGPEGNIEFIGWWIRNSADTLFPDVGQIVEMAHKELH